MRSDADDADDAGDAGDRGTASPKRPRRRQGDDAERMYNPDNTPNSATTRSEREYAEMQGLPFIPVTSVKRISRHERELFEKLFVKFVSRSGHGAKLLADDMAVAWNAEATRMFADANEVKKRIRWAAPATIFGISKIQLSRHYCCAVTGPVLIPLGGVWGSRSDGALASCFFGCWRPGPFWRLFSSDSWPYDFLRLIEAIGVLTHTPSRREY